MSESNPPAPGWWQASDDNWYPPEEHPNYTPPPAASLPAPIAAPPAVPPRPADLALAQAGTGEQAKPSRRKWWAIAVAAVLALLVAVGVASVGGTETEVTDDVAQTVVDDVSGDQEPDPEPPAETEVEADPEPDPEPAVGTSRVGTRQNPLAYDAFVPIVFSGFGDATGSIWNVQVAPPRDITDAVMARNSLDEGPPEGVRFVGFDVEMTLASARIEPLSPRFNFSWEILGGSTAAVYGLDTIDGVRGCGFTPNRFDQFAEVFVSGTLTGTVCIPLPAEDLESPDTFVAMNFAGYLQVFATNGARPDPIEVEGSGAGLRGATLAHDVQVPVAFSMSDDAGQSVWNITVAPPRNVDAEMLEESQFNDPPPEGVTFVGFEVEMTLASTDKEPLSPGINFRWEILGGATSAVYDRTTIEGLFGCGTTANGLNDSAEVFVAGTLSGLVCIPIPTQDLGHPDTRIAMNLYGDRITFSDDGPTPAPAEIEPGAGVAGVGPPFPFGEAFELSWDSFGDADRSTWSTTITNWRDMTRVVNAANPYNDRPPEGAIFVGFDVEMTLIEAEEEPLSTIFNLDWEVLGSVTNRVYGQGTIGPFAGCGVTPSGFDDFDRVFVGGTLSGTVCMALPASDFADAGTRIAMNFSDGRVTFDPDQ